jgi:hypothetical protein
MPVKNSKEKEPPVPKQIEDLKKLYTDRLSSNLSRANATLITWVSALLLILITTLLPLSMDLQTKFEHKTSVTNNKQQLEEEEDEFNQLKSEKKPDQISAPVVSNKAGSSNSNKPPPAPATGNKNTGDLKTGVDLQNRLDEQNRDVVREKGEVASSSEQFTQIKNEMAEIPLPFGKLPIRKIYSPVLWAALFAGFIGFFLFIRIRIFSMLARIIDIHRVSGKLPEEFEGLGTGIPFWLAPLPKIVKKQATDEVVSRGDLEHFMGWKRDSLRNAAITTACLVFGFVIAGNVVYAIYRSLKLTWSDSPKIGVAILIATSGFCLIALFSTLFWLIPRIELQGFSTRVMGRRYFIAGAGAVLAASAAVFFTPQKYLYQALLKKAPRFRRRERHLFGKEVRDQFCSPRPSKPSAKERLVYYVGANLFSSHVYKFAKGRKNNAEFLSRFDTVEARPRENIIEDILTLAAAAESGRPKTLPAGQPAFRIVPRQFSAVVECLALEHVKAGNIDRAMELLWEGIHGDWHTGHPGCRKFAKHPDYRLYDLMAGLAFKYSNDGYRQNMIRHVEDNWFNNVRMLERVKRWRNPSERWASRWAKDQPLNWKHPFVNWKDASKPKDSAYAEYLI